MPAYLESFSELIRVVRAIEDINLTLIQIEPNSKDAIALHGAKYMLLVDMSEFIHKQLESGSL